MGMDNIQLKQEEVLNDEVVFSDINPVSNTKSVDDSSTGEKLNTTIQRMWNAINNKLTRVVNSVNGRTGVVYLTSADVGLGDVDNVSYAEIKRWVIQTILEIFQDMQFRMYDSLSEVVAICETNDHSYTNVPFYCDHGLETELENGVVVEDRRAYIGYYFWNESDGTLQHVERAINTIGWSDDSIIYVTKEDDYNPNNLPLGGIGVNIHKEEAALYVHHSSDKSESGLKIDASKIVPKVYFCDGVYGNEGTEDDTSALLSYSEETQGPEVTICFNGESMGGTNVFYLRKNSDLDLHIGDQIVCNFKAYTKEGIPYSPLHKNMSFRLMSRRPAIGYVSSAPSFEDPDAPYVIDFRPMMQKVGFGLQYIQNHINDAIPDKELTIRLATDVNLVPRWKNGKDPKNQRASTNISGLYLTADATTDQNPVDPGQSFHTENFKKVTIASGNAGEGYKKDDLVRVIFTGGISNTLVRITNIDEETGAVKKVEVETNPDVYVKWGLPTDGVGKTYLGSDDKYGAAEYVQLLEGIYATYNVTETDGTGLKVKLSKGDFNSGGVSIRGFHAMVTPAIQTSFNGGGLTIMTDTSLCNMSYYMYGRYSGTDGDDGDKDVSTYTRSDGETVGIGSREVENYSVRRSITGLDNMRQSQELQNGVLNDLSMIGVNLQKEIQIMSGLNWKYGGQYTFRNISGLRIEPFYYDALFKNNSSESYIGIPDQMNSKFNPVSDMDGRVTSGGLQINVGRFLEIDPGEIPENTDEYYNSGKVQVRTGNGLKEQISYYKIKEKGSKGFISTWTPFSARDWETGLYYYDPTMTGISKHFLPIPKHIVYTIDSSVVVPDDFIHGKESSWAYDTESLTDETSRNNLGDKYDQYQPTRLFLPLTYSDNTYDSIRIPDDDEARAELWESKTFARISYKRDSINTVSQYGDIYIGIKSNRITLNTDETLMISGNRGGDLSPRDGDHDESTFPKIGVRTPIREYESGQIYEKNQLLEYNGKVYVVVKDYVQSERNSEALTDQQLGFLNNTDKAVSEIGRNTYTAYYSVTPAIDMEKGYLSNRFANEAVVEYEVGQSYPYGQLVQHEGKLYLVIKSYSELDYKSQSINEDIDLGFLSNAFNTSIRKVLYFRDMYARTFTYDPSGTKETREAEAKMTDDELKRYREYEYVKLGPGLKITGGEPPIETLCDKAALREYLKETVRRLSVAESILYAKMVDSTFGLLADSLNDDKSTSTPADDNTSTSDGDVESTTSDTEVTLQNLLEFEESFVANLGNMAAVHGGMINTSALGEKRTLNELRAFKDKLDAAMEQVRDTSKFFPTRKAYLLDDYSTLGERVYALLKSATNKVNRKELYQAVIDYFGLGSTTTPSYNGIAPKVYMEMEIRKMEWLFNDWAAMVYAADEATSGFEDDNTSTGGQCCGTCTCPDCTCECCLKNPNNGNNDDSIANAIRFVGYTNTGGPSNKGVQVFSDMNVNSTYLVGVPKGTRLICTIMPGNSSWVKITYNGKTGYMLKQNVGEVQDFKSIPETPSQAVIKYPYQGYIELYEDMDNSGPSSSYGLSAGHKFDADKFEIINLNWTQITFPPSGNDKYGTVTGYIETDRLWFI